MKCRITYTKDNGKKGALIRKTSGEPREFSNKEKARQFIRNHKYQYEDMQIKEIEE